MVRLLARALPLFTLALTLSTSGPARAFWFDSAEDLRPRRDQRPAVTGSFRAYKLTSTHGRTLTVRLPRPAALNDALPLPAGEWAELTLILDGEVIVDGVDLALETLTVPLADPEAHEVHLEWSLPAELSERLHAGERTPALLEQLGVALADGGLATP